MTLSLTPAMAQVRRLKTGGQRARRGWSVALASAILAGAVASGAHAAPGPLPSFQLPFRCGEKWQINSYAGSHAPALDMVREPNQVGTEGAPLIAPASGVVNQSYRHRNAGNMIQINHGGGWFTTFIHLQSRSVGVGARVAQGQEIGRVGRDGRTSNGHPHLHYELAVDANGNGSATWGYAGSERVPAWFDGVRYGARSGETWRNVVSRNCPGAGGGPPSSCARAIARPQVQVGSVQRRTAIRGNITLNLAPNTGIAGCGGIFPGGTLYVAAARCGDNTRFSAWRSFTSGGVRDIATDVMAGTCFKLTWYGSGNDGRSWQGRLIWP